VFVAFRKVIRESKDSDITSLLMEGGALWLGTRDGYLLLLDLYSMLEGHEPLLGLQYCGSGKVKCVAAISSPSSSKLQARLTFSLQPVRMWLGRVTCRGAKCKACGLKV